MISTTDKYNVSFIILSAVLAYFFPLELFIFSLAILGPLHYITEINWLKDKNFFFASRNWVWLLIGTISSLILFLPRLYIEYGDQTTGMYEVMVFIKNWSNAAIFIPLLLAIANQFVKSAVGWVLVFIAGFIGSIVLVNVELYNAFIGFFIPTIIHVYIFTLIFMYYGAKKSKTLASYLPTILGIIVPFIIISIPVDSYSYTFSDTLKNIYLNNDFHTTPVIFSKYLGISDGTSFYFYETMELRLMMFMSFIYCYHYLNWFAKTTVIQWHKSINTKKSIAIVSIWVFSVVLFYYDFRLGFLISLFLSFMHVILEFPLNILSLKAITSKQ